jgi:outer membrane lipoprotein-sorting protein
MKTAYEAVYDYRTLTVVKNIKSDGVVEMQRFLYSFRKPKQIRVDFEIPHRGMILVYPDKGSKVLVKLPGVAHVLPFHLSPDNPHFVSIGQRIDQTDMGLLIEKISHSLTDERRGSISLTEDAEAVQLQVLALDHFVRNVVTLYRFRIDRRTWLPVSVEQSTAEGNLQRTVTFHDFKSNIGLSDRFMEGG